MGEASIMVKACAENTRPASSSRLSEVEVPSDSTYSGRKGKMLEKPTAVISWAKKTMYSVRCQLWRWASAISEGGGAGSCNHTGFGPGFQRRSCGGLKCHARMACCLVLGLNRPSY